MLSLNVGAGMVYTWYNTFILNLFLGLHYMSSINSYLSNVRFFVCFVAMPHGLWDLSSLSRNWTWAMAVKTQNPNHWSTRQLPNVRFYHFSNSNFFLLFWWIHPIFLSTLCFSLSRFPSLVIPFPFHSHPHFLSRSYLRPCLNVFSEWNFWLPYQRWLLAVWPP